MGGVSSFWTCRQAQVARVTTRELQGGDSALHWVSLSDSSVQLRSVIGTGGGGDFPGRPHTGRREPCGEESLERSLRGLVPSSLPHSWACSEMAREPPGVTATPLWWA